MKFGRLPGMYSVDITGGCVSYMATSGCMPRISDPAVFASSWLSNVFSLLLLVTVPSGPA